MALAVTLAVGLSALYLIPASEQLVDSTYMTSRGSGLFSTPLQFLLGFLFPDFWGNPTRVMGNVWIGWGNYCELIAYWGIVPLIIAVFGLFLGRKHKPLHLFALLTLLLSLSLTYGIWPLKYLRALPGLSQTVPARWHFGIALAGSIFSAMGLEYLMARRNKRASVALITTLIAGLLAYVVATIASPDIIRTRFADYPRLVQSHYWQIGFAAVTLTLLATYAALHKRFPRSLFGTLVIAFTLGDLLGFAPAVPASIADEGLYPDTPGIRFLQSQTEPYRAVPWGPFPGVLPAYTANVYGIPIVTGLDHYRERSYQEFLGPLMSQEAQQTAQRFGYVRLDQGIETNHLVLDLLNARYIVTTPDGISSDRLTAAYEGPDMRVYENPSALPRAWGVPNYELLSHDDALLRVHQEDFDPAETVLLEATPPLDVERSSCGSQELESEVTVYTNDEIVAQTDFACDGFLVISERFTPGWEATVDGTPSTVLRADYLLRAVHVPAGQHTVHLKYSPSANRWGAAISLAFLVMWCSVVGFLWKRWRGATLVGLLAPTAVALWFAQPFRELPPVTDRWVEIETRVPDSIAPQAQTARWRDELGTIEFLGYDIDRTSVAPRSTLRLTLFWRSGPRVARDYTVFTHLLDSGLQRWAQQDKLPLDGMAPTSSWQDGEVIADMFDLTVDATAPATKAHLEIGLYDWTTGGRMPLFDVNGNRLANDVLVLDSEIEIKP
ncbi:MAG: YfhO family protein [Ardenticatenia bacterium]|nr:YfhO family protein [Ardenticatenia bacterium]